MRSGGGRYLVVQPGYQSLVQVHFWVEKRGGTDLIGGSEDTTVFGKLELDVSFNDMISTHQPNPGRSKGAHRKSPPRASIT
jgi:hypothetical protein